MQTRVFALLFAAAVAISFAACPIAKAAPKAAAVAAAQKLAASAKAAYIARDYDKAAILYAEALKNVDHENLWFTYGRSLEQAGQFKTSAMAYGRAVALMAAGPMANTIAARAAASNKLDEAQQLLADGQPAQALPLARAAHAALIAQSKRAEDGQNYPESASVLLLLARLELATGNPAVAQQMLVEIHADPTAPPKVVERAAQLAASAAKPAVSNEEGPGVGANTGAGLRARPPSVPPEPKVIEAPASPKSAETARAETAKSTETTETARAETAKSPNSSVTATAPTPQKQPLSRWIALGSTAAIAIAGGVLLGMSISEKNAIQSKQDAALATGKPVDGMSLSDYTDTKIRLDRNYFAGSALAIGGGVGVAASALWLWLGADEKVVVVPQLNGATVVVAW